MTWSGSPDDDAWCARAVPSERWRFGAYARILWDGLLGFERLVQQ
jgi:hypothetical protein